MQFPLPGQWKSALQTGQQQLTQTLQAVWQPFQQVSNRSRLMLLATGLGLGVGVPAYAASVTFQAPPAPPQTQLVSQKPRTVELTLVSFAVTKDAYSRIIPQFQQKWKREQGQDVRFSESYGGSASQARAVIDGLEADIVGLALSLDVDRIQQSGLIRPGWTREVPNSGIVTRSVVTIVTRQGNPKGIRNWSDLAKPGIRIISANPKTSGVARWNFLALWGSVSQTGGNEARALDFVTRVFRNVPILAKDAREASDIFFKKDQGDALLNYENEVILAAQKGETGFTAITPSTNISIDNPIAVVDKNVDKKGTRKVAEAFVQFLFTPQAQREFARVGFRPVAPAVNKEFSNKFAKVNKLYTVSQLGGWDQVQKKFFDDGAVFDRIYRR